MNDLQTLCSEAGTVVRQAAQFIQAQAGRVKASQVEEKAPNSLVSYVDQQAEALLVEGLSRLLPEATFLTEEGMVDAKESALRWIIDPLDGTTNFLFQLPVYSVSVGLELEGQPVLGIVHEINRNEQFCAWKDGGAWLNGTRIQVTPRGSLSTSLAVTGFPYDLSPRLDQSLDIFRDLLRKTRGVRRLGSAAVDLAYVACGRFDAFYEHGLSAWDVAGGIVLVQEAGGLLSDYSGGQDYLFGGEILAVQPALQADYLAIIQKHWS